MPTRKFVQYYGEETKRIVTVKDGVIQEKSNGSRWWFFMFNVWQNFFVDVFMPRGYPHSVSDDYLQYQLWDTLQAFASSMTAALATEAVLRGVGVGDEKATALAAALTWLLKDGLGMISRILFAWLNSASLDANCKQWRLIADVLNDIAFTMDLISPAFPKFFIYIICCSSIARSVVGVAGSATRISIVQHQACSNNIADVSAKDGSQETLVNVCALICSLILLPLVSGNRAMVWILHLIFTCIHLFSNYKAVISLRFQTINYGILSVIMKKYLSSGSICNVSEANRNEISLGNLLLSRRYGCNISEALSSNHTIEFSNKRYLITFDELSNKGYLAMASSCTAEDELKAAVQLEHVCLSGRLMPEEEIKSFMASLSSAHWKTSSHRLNFDQWSFREV